MNFQDLENIFEIAIQQGYCVGVEITIPGQCDSEFIINRNKSIPNKLEYYRNNYTDDLIHKNCSAIKIIDVVAFPELPLFLTVVRNKS